jgi:formylglycine-generating enzyme required for sulfatase activity
MVVIPAGSFLMGSPNDEPERRPDEGPQRRVNVAAFAIGKYEVTQGQWKAVMGSNPSRFLACGDECPVEQVSWDDAQEYIRRLRAKTGKSYRLPSEAEWEYAARAGTTTPFHTGSMITAAQANFDGNYTYAGSSKGEYRQTTMRVGSFSANAFGLHDMHGNVWEWVQDCYDKDAYAGKAPSDGRAYEMPGCSSRVLRGGSWSFNPAWARSAHRVRYPPGNRSLIGFRLARMLP